MGQLAKRITSRYYWIGNLEDNDIGEAPASPPPEEEPSWYESMANDVASIFNSDESIGDKLLDTASYAINGVGNGIQTVADAGVDVLKGGMGFVGNAVSDIGDWAHETGNKISAAYENPTANSIWEVYDQGIAKPGMAIASTPFVPGQARAVAGALALPAVASDAINAFSEGDGVMEGTGNVISSFVVDPVSQLVKAASNPAETGQAIYEHPSKIWTDILEPGMVVEMPARGAKKAYDNRGEIKADYKAFREDGVNGVLDRRLDKGFKDVSHSLRSNVDDGSIREPYTPEESYSYDDYDYAPEETAPSWDIREDEFIGQPMPHGENGCVEAVVRLGQDNDFLGREYEAGNAYVPTLVEHARAEGLYEPFDPSRVEKGDVIVYDGDEHVVMADGEGGYIGNSSSQQRVVHGSDYNEMGSLTPTGLIKTGKGSGGERRIRDFEDYPEESYSGEVKPLGDESPIDDWDMSIYEDEIERHNSDLIDEQAREDALRDIEEPADPMREDINRLMGIEEEPREPVRTMAERVDFAEDEPISHIDSMRADVNSLMGVELPARETRPESLEQAPLDSKTEALRNRIEAVLDKNEYRSADEKQIDLNEQLEQDIVNENTYDGYSEPDDIFSNNYRDLGEIELSDAGEINWDEGSSSMTRQELFNDLDNLWMKSRETTDNGIGDNILHEADYGDLKVRTQNISQIINNQLSLDKIVGEKFDSELADYMAAKTRIDSKGTFAKDTPYGEAVRQRFLRDMKPNDRRTIVSSFIQEALTNEANAKQLAPNLYRVFKEELGKNQDLAGRVEKTQGMLKTWNEMPEGAKASASIEGYNRSGGFKEALQHPMRAIKEKVSDISNRFAEEMLDDKHPLKQVSAEIENRTGTKLTASEDPYIQARLAQGRGEAQASMLIDHETNLLTKGMDSRSESSNAQKVANALNRIFGAGTIQKPVILKDVLNNLAKDLEGKYPEYLKSIGVKNWLEALDSYLLSSRLLEIKEVGEKQSRDRHLQALNESTEIRFLKGELQKSNGYSRDELLKHHAALEEIEKGKLEQQDIAYRNLMAAENYKMPFSAEQAHAVVDNAPKELIKAAKDIYQYNDNLMRISRSAGLISDKFYKAMNEKYQKYVPLASDMGEGMEGLTNMSSGGGKGIVNIGNVVDAINRGGSTKNIKSPLQTIALNTKRTLSAANRNMAGQKFVELVEKHKGMGDILERVEDVDSVANKDNIVSVSKKGIRQFFETEPSIKRALECIDAPYQASMVEGILQLPAAFLRASCTITPAFLAKNLFRDMMGAPTLGGMERVFKLGLDHARGLKSRAMNDQTWYDYQASGATMANLLTVDRQGVAGMIENLYGEGAWDITKKVLTSPVRLGTWLNELSENATRAGKFAGDLKNGMTLDEAAIGAKNVSLDFSRAGRFGRQVNRYIPFFNAAIQEPVRLYEVFRENPKKVAAVIGVSITLPSVITWTLNHNEEWFQNLPDYERDTNWFITKDFKIPKPFGLGVLFGSSVERGLDQLAGTNEGRKFMPYLKNLIDALTPGGTPQVIAPWIEWQSNHSFFKDAPIVPEKYQRLTPDKQYNDSTSQMARDIAGFFGTSPMKVDNLLRGAGGSGVSLGLDTWDAAMGNRNVKNPLKIHSAFTPSTYSRFNSEYYNIKQEVEARYNSTDKGTSKRSKDNQQHRMNQLSAEDRRDYNIFKAADKKIQAIDKDRYLSDEEKQAKKSKVMKDAVKASSRYSE